MDDQDKNLKDALASVKKNAYFMHKAMVRHCRVYSNPMQAILCLFILNAFYKYVHAYDVDTAACNCAQIMEEGTCVVF